MFSFFKRKNNSNKLFFNTDVHCHLIPGVDDGSGSVEESLKLIKALQELGVNSYILTPHVKEYTFENDRTTLASPLEELRTAIANEGLEIALAQSAEYRIDEFFENKVLGPKDFMPMPNNHILLESNWQQEPMNLNDVVYQCATCGMQPIFAHPERYRYLNERYDRYEFLHSHNLMFQVNLLSFAGFYGKTARETAYWMLEKGMVDFVGTDIHNDYFLKNIKAFVGSKDYKSLLQKIDKSKSEIKNDTAFK